ncbi:hypothetical protein OROGR_016003 [Orobanche gracilis]
MDVSFVIDDRLRAKKCTHKDVLRTFSEIKNRECNEFIRTNSETDCEYKSL